MRRAMRLGLVALLIGFTSLPVLAASPDGTLGEQLAAAAKRKVAPLSWVTATSGRDRFNILATNSTKVAGNNEEFICVNAIFTDADACKNFQVDGTYPLARFGRYLDVFVPTDDEKVLDNFFDAPGLQWIEMASTPILPPPDRPIASKDKPRAIPDRIVTGGAFGLSGKGVIVAVIDTGIDFHHPDFITYDAAGKPTSRILYYWDTFSEGYANGVGQPAPVKFPNGAPIGTVYSRDDLTAELRNGRPKIVEWDINGHGTACAGVAAGNGNASDGKLAGVAPQADIIAVRIGGVGPGLEHTFLINAITAWLDEVAGKRPLVVSCSYGGHQGPHDGSRIEEQHLSARFSPERVGRAICISAGNEGHTAMHGETKFGGSDAPGEFTWASRSPAQITIYVDTPDVDDLSLEWQDKEMLRAIDKSVNPITGRTMIEMIVNPGEHKLTCATKSGKTYPADAYIMADDSRAGFTNKSRSLKKMVGTPATAASAIAVGSYNWNDQFDRHGAIYLYPDVVRPRQAMAIGELSGYSNPGFVSDSGVKPEIVAPGQWYAAPAPLNADSQRNSSGLYQLFNGTSAAAPYAAGVVALVFEKKPTLTLADVQRLLKQNASQDRFTGSPPNPEWGHGKLNLNAVERLLTNTGTFK